MSINDPQVLNQVPAPDAEDVSRHDFFHFSLRDAQSEVDLSTVHTYLGFGRAYYDPSTDGPDLPEEVGRLSDDEDTIGVSLRSFSDTGAPGTPGSTPDGDAFRSLLLDELVIEKTSGPGTYQNGTYYFKDTDLTGLGPLMADFRIEAAPVVVGPLRKALLLFVCHDGMDFYIRICSPATDGSGTRVEHGSIILDPSGNAEVKVVWDARTVVDEVIVTAQGGPAIDPGVVKVPASAVGTVLPGITLGPWQFVEPQFESGILVGLDGRDTDTVYVRLAAFQPIAANVVRNGSVQAGSSGVVLPNPVVEYDGTDDPLTRDEVPWLGSGVGVGGVIFHDEATNELVISKAAAGILPHLLHEERMPDADGWAFEVELSAASLVHAGTTPTGAGVLVSDGVRSALIALIDDYVDAFMGVYSTPGAVDTHDETKYTRAEISWGASPTYLFVTMNHTRAMLSLFDADGVLRAEVPYASLPTAPEGQVAIGFTHQAMTPDGVSGDIVVHGARFFPGATTYEARLGQLPPTAAPPWAELALGTGVSAISGDLLDLDDPDYGDPTGPAEGYLVYYRPGDIGPTYGGGARARFKISEWSDNIGTPEPAEKGIFFGPGVFDGSYSAYLCFVDSGTQKYVFVPTSDVEGSLEEVLAQSEDGQSFSAVVDFTVEHEYLLIMQPQRSIRVYIDGATAPVIEIPWKSGFDLPPEPVPLPVACAFFGSYGGWSAARGQIASAARHAANGVDVSVRKNFSDDEVDRVAGALANLLVEAGDV
jgi:hypothetical protein